MTKKEAIQICKKTKCIRYTEYGHLPYIKNGKPLCNFDNKTCWWIVHWFDEDPGMDLKNYFKSKNINKDEIFEKIKPLLMFERLKGAKK